MYKTFGKYLKELRQRSGKTLRQVENETKISNAYLSQLENSSRIPTLLTLSDLAASYGVEFSELANIAHRFLKKNVIEATLSPAGKQIAKDYDALPSDAKAAIAQFVRSYKARK